MTARRSHPRLRLLAALGVGVVLTVLAAWLAATFSDLKSSTFLPAPFDSGLAPLRVRTQPDWTLRTWLVRSGPGLRHDLTSECIWVGSTLGASESTNPNRTRETISVGWPLPALQWTSYEAQLAAPPPGWNAMTFAGAWSRGLPQLTKPRTLATGDERRFPIRPIPVGFSIDVAAFTLAAWWAIEWYVRLRTTRRTKRGACVTCGYDLRGHPEVGATCPECGRQTEVVTATARIPA